MDFLLFLIPAQNHPVNHNGMQYVDPNQGIYPAEPINSVPYTGPPLVPDDDIFPPQQGGDGPARVFLPYPPPEKDMHNFLSCSIGGVVLTESAALGKVGSPIGLMDFGESEDGYIFRISVPGVSKDQFSCEVEPSGKVVIVGVTTTGEETVQHRSIVFEMQTQNLCPPGEFSATLMLPGPVDPKTFVYAFNNGMLAGKVKKSSGEAMSCEG